MYNTGMAYADLPEETQQQIAKAYDAGQHLYFIRASKIRLVKIGVSQNPKKRLSDLQVGSPVKLKLLFVLPFGGVFIEKKLHKQFEDFHSRGEWYEYNPEVMNVIKDMRNVIRRHKWIRYANQLLRD